MLPDATYDEALTDVLRLARGMTYKNAVAGLPLGGAETTRRPAPPRRAEEGLSGAIPAVLPYSRHDHPDSRRDFGPPLLSTWALGVML